MSAFLGEYVIVLFPHDQSRRLVLAEVCLPLRVASRIAPVVEEQRELDLLVPGSVEQELIYVPVVGTDGFGVPRAS